MFRQFFDTSFNDYREVRIVLQEISPSQVQQSSVEFQQFCTTMFNHKSFSFEQFKIKFCYVKESLIRAESSLFDIQFYRRPFAFLLFTVVQTGEELQRVLDQYTKIRHEKKDNIFVHLFVRYKSLSDQDDPLQNEHLLNGLNDDDVDSYPSINQKLQSAKFQDTISIDGSGSTNSDRISLSESCVFHAAHDEETDEFNDSGGVILRSSTEQPKLSRLSMLKDKALSTNSIFHLFESNLAQVLNRLEMNLAKYVLETNQFDSKNLEQFSSSNDSHLIDIRLMIDCEKDCTLIETHHLFLNDKHLQAILNEFNMRIMLNLFNHYIKANIYLNNECGRNRLSKKTLDTRTIKRKADCCLLIGAIEKAYSDYRSVADLFKSQNDHLWHAAALEGRIAASYASAQKPKRQAQKQTQFFRQNSLIRRLPVEKYFNRSNTPLNLKDRLELALQIYSSTNRGIVNKDTIRMELDICLRWCSLLWEQNDVKKYREDIDYYILQINRLGSYLEEHIDSIYLNAYLAETYAFIGLKRKSALYYRSAAFSGLCLITEQNGYNDEISFFHQLIKRARKAYGIEDNQVIFPLIQKTILNESIQISLRNDDFTTIIEDVHFAIETLIEYMTDAELEALLTFLNASDQSIVCSYCSIPRLKTLDILPLSNRLKAYKAEPKGGLFIYRPEDKSKSLSKHQSLQRHADGFWVKNQPAQITLEVDNYLPSTMVISRLELITDKQLETKLDVKYKILARKTKRLIIDCIPRESGLLQIQGLKYHIWSTNQEFLFADFPAIRQCSCFVEVVNELPILDDEYILINNQTIELSSTSTKYHAQIHRGDEIIVTIGVKNTSTNCDINSLTVQTLVSGIDLSDYVKILALTIPLSPDQKSEVQVDLSEIYDRYLARQYRFLGNVEHLNVEIRLNYSNEFDSEQGHYRQNTTELRLNYLVPLTVQIEEVQNDEDDLAYLMFCKITNYLTEDILIQDNVVKSSESSTVIIKQEKIQLDEFPIKIEDLLVNIRNHLPTSIKYTTINSNKQLQVSIDTSYFSNENIEKHANILVQSPFTSYWHLEKILNILHIHLCVTSKVSHILNLEYRFPKLNDRIFLDSNQIQFSNINQGEYLTDKRTLILSQENDSNVVLVDICVNNIAWKRLTLTF